MKPKSIADLRLRFKIGTLFPAACFKRFALLLLMLPLCLQAQDYAYTVSNGEITITRYTGPGGVVTLPDQIGGMPVTGIGGWAFQYSHRLEELIIPETVRQIGDWAFAGCSKLRSVAIPGSVTNIGDRAFIRCASLTEIKVNPSNQVFSSLEGALLDKNQTTLIQCPGGKVGSFTVPNSVTRIGAKAFDHCNRLTSIDLGDSVNSIGEDAFYFCGNLQSVTFPGTLASLENWTFQYCTNLAAVYFTGDAPRAGSYVFYGCGNATAYYLPGSYGWSERFAQLPTSTWSPSSIRVFLSPGDAGSAGGRWRIGNGDWLETGATVTNLPPGDHTVCFSSVPGWITPACQTLTVRADSIAIGSAAYELASAARATANAVVADGFVIGVNIIKSGTGYDEPPAVYLVGGGGTGAQAVATVNNRSVVSVTVVNAGFGYSTPPTVVITKPDIRPLELSLTPASVLSFANLEPGSAYQLQTLVSDQWLDVAGPVEAESAVYSMQFDDVTDRWSYRLISLPRPIQALADPVVTNGFLVRVVITNSGLGYASTPEVKIIGDSGKSARCQAVLENGMVTAITVLDAGSGYTNKPIVQIDPPPTITGVLPTVTKSLRLEGFDLVPGLSYQFESSTDGQNWTDWGQAFVGDTETRTEYLLMGETIRMFRLRQWVP